jgi:hypothetical protein
MGDIPFLSFERGRNLSPNIEITENKIKWYSTVITIDYIYPKGKNRSATFELGGAKNPGAPLRFFRFGYGQTVRQIVLRRDPL